MRALFQAGQVRAWQLFLSAFVLLLEGLSLVFLFPHGPEQRHAIVTTSIASGVIVEDRKPKALPTALQNCLRPFSRPFNVCQGIGEYNPFLMYSLIPY